MQDFIAMRTTISLEMLKHSLWRGMCLAIIGLSAIIYSGIFATIPFLMNWGVIIFLLGGGLITFGLLPYRKLCYQQLHPHEIHLTSYPYQFEWYADGSKQLTIPSNAIACMEYITDNHTYGIVIRLQATAMIEGVVPSAKIGDKYSKGDLFFPYFSVHTFDELLKWKCEAQAGDAQGDMH